MSTNNVSQFNVNGTKKHLLDTCSKWTANFGKWCRLHFRTNCVKSDFTLMKGTWTHVCTVWVSQTHDLYIKFYHLNIILIFLDSIFMLSRGQACVTTHALEMSTTLVLFRDLLWCTQSQLTGSV